jgi:hypothetical protein
MGRFLLRLAALALIVCWAASARAQPPRPRIGDVCSVGFDPVWISQSYDPMSPNDYVVSFTATARRGGQSFGTNYSALLLRAANYRLFTQVFVIQDDGSGTGGNVVYERPGPNLNPGLDDAGEIDLTFPASGAVNSRTFQMQLRIPAGTAIEPGTFEHVFDVRYLCDYLDGRSDRGTVNRGFSIYLSVNGSVQASLVGTEPDFGEIGMLSDTDVAAAGPSVNLRRHYLRVAGTGPYEVGVSSQNGWRMTATGAPTGNAAERIAYRYELLGQQLDSSRPNFTPVRCQASGVAGENIAMTAILTQGGLGKVPSPVYRDIITITIAPLATWVTDTQRCT